MESKLSILNHPARLLPGPQVLTKLVDLQKSPESALEFLGADGDIRRYSYEQLRSHAASLAKTIQRSIGDSRQPIPVLVPQSPALYISQLGILQAGAAFCPINLDAPSERIKFITQDVSANAIITTSEFKDKVTWENGPSVILVDQFPASSSLDENELSDSSFPEPRPQDLAYIMYTSGSTGTPKGVGVSHLAVTQSLLAHDRHIPTFRRFFQFAAPSFDVSVFEIFFPLFRKATLCGCDRTLMLNDLAGSMNKLEVDGAELTPSVASSLLQRRSHVPGLKLLLTIGEMLTRPVVDEFGDSDDREGILYGMYGPTEAAIHCTVYPKMKADAPVGNIGIPFDTVSTFVAAEAQGEDVDIKLLPMGELGELVLGGTQLAEGYLNREEQNRKAFVQFNGEKVYRTGDKARMLPDGTIEILGRMSAGQVKLRGQRVELGEIEGAVYKNPGIKVVHASVIQGALIVFVVPQSLDTTSDEIMETCQKWLPKFMLPTEIVIHESFPYLPSGKINKRELEAQYKEQAESAFEDDTRTPTEKTIANLLLELLGVRVGRTSRLASAGVDSLKAIRVASMLRSSGFNVSPIEVLAAETVETLAQKCDEVKTSDSAQDSNKQDIPTDLPVSKLSGSVDEELVESVMPCTPLQAAMLSETASNPRSYQNVVVLDLPKVTSAEEACSAISALAEHNPILRTGFMESLDAGSAYSQIVWKTLSSNQIQISNSGLSDDVLDALSIERPFQAVVRDNDGHCRIEICIHHALYDAWSLELMIDDLDSILSSSDLAIRPPFQNVVREYVRMSSSDSIWSSKDYWRDHLANFKPQTLPNFASWVVEPGLEVFGPFKTEIPTAALESAARSLGVSPQSFFQAALGMIMKSYTGNQDICFGTVFSGRTVSVTGIEDIVGPCFSTLPIRTDLSVVNTAEELLKQVNSTNRKHLEHLYLPLRDIKKSAGIPPGIALFDTLLVWQQTLHENEHEKANVKLVEERDYLEFNLTLEITPASDVVRFKVTYQRSMLPLAQIGNICEQLQVLVQSFLSTTSAALPSIESSLAKPGVLSVLNPEPQLPTMIGLATPVEKIAAEDPERPAINFARSIDETTADIDCVTYQQLNSRANQLANYLIANGTQADDLVCIIMDKSASLYISILAAIKAGAGYLPLIPETPSERVSYILSQARPRMILTQSSLWQNLDSLSEIKTVSVDELDTTELSTANVVSDARPEHVAYNTYTSGSTGTPKGILVTRENIEANLADLQDLYQSDHTTRLLQSCSQAFDVSVFEILYTWRVGGCLCATSKDILFRDIEHTIRMLDVTHLSMTPTVAALVNPDNVPKVEFLVTCGEMLNQKVFNNWAGRGLWNGYGPSETTNILTVQKQSRNSFTSCIGYLFNNSSAFVAVPGTGDDMSLVLRGGVGEFCFGGYQIFRGYLDTKQNEGKLFDHPKYGKIYRSGDIGRFLPDGSLSIVGRIDDQIKIRGQRVELGEINSVLLRHPEVQDAATLVVKEKNGKGEQLVAFWTKNKGQAKEFSCLSPDREVIEQLYERLVSALPEYMIPSSLVLVSHIPLTIQGKFDKRTLLAAYADLDIEYLSQSSAMSTESASSHSWTDLEMQIREEMALALDLPLESIKPDSSFFALGVDSISAISVSRKLREALQRNVEISDLLKHPSVVRLAETLSKRASSMEMKPVAQNTVEDFGFDEDFLKSTRDAFQAHEKTVKQILPCTPLQEAMLSASDGASDSAYSNRQLLKVNGDLSRLTWCWEQMVQRHNILRTCFVRTDSPKHPYAQVILETSAPRIVRLDLKSPAVRLSSRTGAMIDENAEAEKKLMTTPPLDSFDTPYSLFVSESSDPALLLISMHHALYDGLAMLILFHEIEVLYRGDSLEQTPTPFAPFILHLQSSSAESDEFFDRMMRGFEPRPLQVAKREMPIIDMSASATSLLSAHSEGGTRPSSYYDTVSPDSASETIEQEFSLASTFEPIDRQKASPGRTLLKRVCSLPLTWFNEAVKTNNTSLLAVCQSVWASLLADLTESPDVCFGNVVSGRSLPIPGLDTLVAPCFNTIPLRLKDLHKLSFLEGFRNFHSLNTDSIPFQLTPIRRIQARCKTDAARLFDTLLLLQQSSTELDESLWNVIEETGSMDLPIVIEIIPRPENDTLELILHLHDSAMAHSQASALIRAFNTLLQEGLENPRKPLLPFTSKARVASQSYEQKDAQSSGANGEGSEEGPNAALEADIRAIIADFTDTPEEKIRRNISIYRLGLDSISAVQVASRLRRQGHDVLASDVLQHPSIAQLASHLASQASSNVPEEADYDFAEFDNEFRGIVSERLEVSAEKLQAVRPCTPVQAGMIAQTLHSDGKEYINSMWLELLPGTSLDQLRGAWEAVVEKYEMLRTVFVGVEDSKYPFVMATFERMALPWYDEEAEAVAEDDDTNANVETNDVALRLAREPWSLHVESEGEKKVARFTAHHALYDAHSIELIYADVARVCHSMKLAPSAPVNNLLGAILNASHRDLEDQEKFWRSDDNRIFANKFPELTPLVVSSSKDYVKSHTSSVSLSELERLCREQNVTMQTAGQAAWGRLLSAYTGETVVTFGVTLSGRSATHDADDIAMPSIVTLPLRSEVKGSNAELLAKTQNSNLWLLQHQFTPLTLIQRWAGFAKGEMFDTLFAYQKPSKAREEVIYPWKVVNEEASVDYAVSIELQPTVSDELVFVLTTKESLIPQDHAELVLKQLDHLLKDLLQNPDAACSDVPRSDYVGEQAILSITPAKEPVIPAPVELLHQFVERSARLYPDKAAFEFATHIEPGHTVKKTWSFKELDEEGNRVAHLLREKHAIPARSLIGICFDKCPEASFAIIGILKAGCAYVALDPTAPADRLLFIAKDSKAQIVLSAGKPASMLKEIGLDIIALNDAGILDGISTSPLSDLEISPEDTSYCLYTSGTTGTPKGCEITHKNAVQAMLAFQRLFAGHWTEESRWLQFASFHFDVSVLEQFWSWGVGICVASAPRDLIFEDIPTCINELGITHIDLTPSLARLLHPDDVPSLCKGVFITGGEALRQEILDVWGEKSCIYNGYGPTEATIGVTMYPRIPINGKPANIGPAFDNVGSYVLQPETDKPVLRGAVGELCVSGKLVGKGYLNRPELTAERFPILSGFEERVYRTGDLVRLCHDNSILFLGRADDQVKLRGQRLELGEINEAIKNHVAGLDQVVTLVHKHKNQVQEQLVTFFIPKQNNEEKDLVSEIRNVCKAKLATYMVPTHYVKLEKIPLSANNKADKKQLAAIFDGMDIGGNGPSADEERTPRSPAAQKALEFLGEVLDTDAASLQGNETIFELGIDSITIIGFARKLQNEGYPVKTSTVMQHFVIDDLIETMLASEDGAGTQQDGAVAAQRNIAAFEHRHIVPVAKELGLESHEIESLAPCTAVQEGMVYEFLQSDEPLYFNVFEFALNDEIDIAKLQDAWCKVAERLQVLRTSFVLTDDGCTQAVVKERVLPWIEIEAALEQDFEDLRNHRSKFYANVEKGVALATPWKVAVIKGPRESVLQLAIFHALYDGSSLPMILERVREEYVGVDDIEYGPAFHEALAHGPLGAAAGAEEFWKQYLNDWECRQLAVGESNDAVPDVVVSRTIPDVAALENLKQSLGVTHQSILQAAWALALQSLLSSNMTFGMVVSGRSIDLEDAEKVVGPLFNTIPFHVQVRSDGTCKELVQQCHTANTKLLQYQHTPLKDIQKWCGANAARPLFDTLFVFQAVGADEQGAQLWTQLDVGHQQADYPLSFEAQLNGNKNIELTIVGQGSVIDESLATQLLQEVEKNLTALQIVDAQVPASNPALAATRKLQTQLQPVSTKSRSNMNLDGASDGKFTWIPEALTIKTELAALAKTDDINERSSIFELGLDSIEVIRLVSKLKKHGINIPVSAIIKSQTIEKMMSHISKPKSETKTTAVVQIDEVGKKLRQHLESVGKLPADVEAVLPATPLQEGMVAEMLNSGFARYFNHEVLEVEKSVDLGRLQNAWAEVVRSSPVLRATFVEIDDVDLPFTFAQVIRQTYDQSWETKQLTNDEDFDVATAALTQQAVENAKDGHLLTLASIEQRGKKYIVLSIAHALYDGHSLRALHEDVWRAYNGQFEPRPDFKATLQDVFASNGKEAVDFWRSSLSGVQKSTFPQKPDSDARATVAVHRHERPSNTSLPALQEFCRSQGISLQTLGHTTWSLVLAHYLHQLDVVFGAVLSCRDTDEANEVMFPLMNTVAVRSVLHGSVADMLKYMQDVGSSIRQFQHFPLRQAQALAGASSTESGEGGLFDTLFIYQGAATGSAEKREALYESVGGVAEVEFPVSVEMEVVGEELVWRTACKSSVGDDKETRELLDILDKVLASIVEQPKAQTIASKENGISICGLASFEQTSKKTASSEQVQPAGDESFAWSETAKTIRKVLSEVSKTGEKEITPDQTIYHLGLDSISVIKVSSLLKQEGLRLQVSTILAHNSIRAMEAALTASVSAESTPVTSDNAEVALTRSLEGIDVESVLESADVSADNVESILPATAGQHYLYSTWIASMGEVFFPEFKYRIKGEIDPRTLTDAWAILIQQNSILRTLFVPTEDKDMPLVQVVLKECTNPIAWSEDDDSSSRSQNPLLRLMIVNGTFRLKMHHALYDAISLPVLLSRLQELYNDHQSPATCETNFQGFITQSLATTHTPTALKSRKQFWRQYLSGISFPAKSTGGARQSSKRIDVFQPSLSIPDIKATAKHWGVTTDALLLASFAKTYHSLPTTRTASTPEGDAVVIGLYLSNRSAVGVSSFPTLNFLPLVVRSVARRSAEELAVQIQADLKELTQEGVVGTSLAEIAEWTRVERVDCWVNILKTAESESESEQKAGTEDGGLVLEDCEMGLMRKREEVVVLGYEAGLPEMGSAEKARFKPGLDVEMRLGGEGGLDVGLFASTSVCSIEGAREIVKGLVTRLSVL